MIKNILIKLKSFLLVLITLAICSFTASNVSAVTYGKTCEIFILPYKSDGEEITYTYLPNYASEEECKKQLDYPSASTTGKAYNTRPPSLANPENKAKSGDENKKVPWTIHQHAYFNDKQFDEFYYKSAVDKFEITVQSDGYDNLDFGEELNNLFCHTPAPAGYKLSDNAKNCNGYEKDLYGGTKITKTTSGEKIVVTWEFGINENKDKPVLFGNNGSGFTVHSAKTGEPTTINLTDPYNPYRKLEFWLNFKTKNNKEEIWSATTASRVLLTDLAIKVNNFSENSKKGCYKEDINNKNSGWCYLKTENPYDKIIISKGGTARTYYWYPIGSVATIWRKPAQPPPPIIPPPIIPPVIPPPVIPPPVLPPVIPPVTPPITPPVTPPIIPPIIPPPITPPVLPPVTPPVTQPITPPITSPPVIPPIIPPVTPPPVYFIPPELHKIVRRTNSSEPYTKLTLAQGQDQILEYQLTFIPKSPNTSATITDTISNGSINSETNITSKGTGQILFQNRTVVTQNGVAMPICDLQTTINCYTGDIGRSSGIMLKNIENANPVIIKYLVRLNNSQITDKICVATKICQEKYKNIAKAQYTIQQNGRIVLKGVIQSENVLVQLFCPYILTRAAGDIFLEAELNAGIDINQCAPYKSAAGLIVKPGLPPVKRTPSVGQSTVFTIRHEVCAKGQEASLKNTKLEKYYGAKEVSKNLSSQICSVKLLPGKNWQKEIIVNSIKENKTRLSRWKPNLNNFTSISSFDQLANIPSTNGVYHLKDKSLTIGNGIDLTLNDGQGAKTFIVENGNLIIKNNIKYGECVLAGTDACSSRNTASLAFIVLNGNVYVDPEVKELSGVFFTQREKDKNNGKFLSGSPNAAQLSSQNRLNIYGSVYGDIEPLFKAREIAGDPSRDEGSIVIRFDERIILNTPPGLQDVLRLSESPAAR